MNTSWYICFIQQLWIIPICVAAILVLPLVRNQVTDVGAKYLGLLVHAILILIVVWLFLAHQQFLTWDQYGPISTLNWVSQWGVQISAGLDGLSLSFIALSILLSFLVYGLSVKFIPLQQGSNFLGLYCLLLAGLLGTFLATNLVFFYICWEVVLIPIFIMVAIWGGARRREANIRFLLFSFSGSLLMLMGMTILAFYYKKELGQFSFDYFNLKSILLPFDGSFTSLQFFAFLTFLAAFFIKGHIFPLHSWLPALYKEGHPAVTFALSALLFNMASYAMIRFLPTFFPQAFLYAQPVLLYMGAAGVVFGACCTIMQHDLRTFLAYMSVSHMGYFLLGLAALTTASWQASFIQTMNHAILATGFCSFIFYLAHKKNTFDISFIDQVAKKYPLFSFLSFIILLANMGLPGTNGFVGEFLVLLTSFQVGVGPSVLATVGVILVAVYMLKMAQRIFFHENASLVSNATFGNKNRFIMFDYFSLTVICILIILLGTAPMEFFKPGNAVMSKQLQGVQLQKDFLLPEAAKGLIDDPRTEIHK